MLWVSDSWLPEWAEAGWIAPIDGYPQLTKYNSDTDDFCLQSMRYKGKQYGLTYYSDYMAFFYDDQLLKKAGINVFLAISCATKHGIDELLVVSPLFRHLRFLRPLTPGYWRSLERASRGERIRHLLETVPVLPELPQPRYARTDDPERAYREPGRHGGGRAEQGHHGRLARLAGGEADGDGVSIVAVLGPASRLRQKPR